MSGGTESHLNIFKHKTLYVFTKCKKRLRLQICQIFFWIMVVDVVISEFFFCQQLRSQEGLPRNWFQLILGTALHKAIVGAADRLVTTLVIEAAIRQVTVFVTAVLPVVKMSLALMDVVVPPVAPLIILNVVSMKRIVRNVEFLMMEVFEEFLWLMFWNLV